MNQIVRECDTLEATELLGRELGALLFPGAVVALIGAMGAGKTTLTRAIAAGFGAEERSVSSPTYALVHEYAGKIPVYHFDTYRLPDLKAFLDLGVAEYFQSDGVCIIEWADRVEAALPEEHVRVTIDADGNIRRFTLEGHGAGYEELISRLQSQD